MGLCQFLKCFISNNCFFVLKFLFREFQVSFFGINTFSTTHHHPHTILNPGPDYVFQGNEMCMFIAFSMKDVEAIEKLVISDSFVYIMGLLILFIDS
jgi:hypothetical protein